MTDDFSVRQNKYVFSQGANISKIMSDEKKWDLKLFAELADQVPSLFA